MIELVKVPIRCGEMDIELGASLRVAFDFEPRKYPEEMHLPSVRTNLMEVDLFVEAFEAYGGWLDVMPSGHTGIVHLLGYDALAITESKMALGTRDEKTYIILCKESNA